MEDFTDRTTSREPDLLDQAAAMVTEAHTKAQTEYEDPAATFWRKKYEQSNNAKYYEQLMQSMADNRALQIEINGLKEKAKRADELEKRVEELELVRDHLLDSLGAALIEIQERDKYDD